MCPWIQRLIIINHKFQKQLNNDHCLQFITGTTVDPPAKNSSLDNSVQVKRVNDGIEPWVRDVDWNRPYILYSDIFGCCDGKNISQFSG